MRVDYRFCPACGSRLLPREVEGRWLPGCPSCEFVAWPDPKVAVAVLAHDARGQLLLIRRGTPPAQGEWALPGGYVDANETPSEAARRELLEETGLELEVERLEGVHHVPVGEGGGLLVLAYVGRLSGGEGRTTPEALELVLVDPAKSPELGFSAHREALAAWRAGGV
ncbi:MAG: NUDIX domain-containing protein [Candidatus Dormibacteraeota bacterium]|nr:NUDIX domain-containing protein [Candidatus Dormibacteraeota bacterium]